MTRRRLLPATLIGAALVLLAVGVVGLLGTGSAPAAVPAPAARPVAAAHSLTAAIDAAQVRLRTLPKDDTTWAQLGSAYVQQARITGDSSYYPKAQGVLERSLQIRPTGNVAAMVGMGSLANARHEFAQAKDWGTKAAAADPSASAAYGVLNDALTQLGDYAGADAALQRMLDLQPGISSFSRASYSFEQRGDVAGARSSMERALAEATDGADIGFCRYYLGELAFNGGDPAAALEQYRLGLIAAPTSDQLLAGRAKSEAALGRSDDAVRDYTTVVGRLPLPEYILEFGQYLDSLGRPAEAKAQYAVLASVQSLFAANGVVDDLTAAAYEADHGSPASAVQHAQAEWARRHSVLVADALGWALHRAGRDAEALTYAEQADRLGWRNATFAYHRGMIELSLGRRDDARRDLTRAMSFNPHFSPLQAPRAAAALASLGGPR